MRNNSHQITRFPFHQSLFLVTVDVRRVFKVDNVSTPRASSTLYGTSPSAGPSLLVVKFCCACPFLSTRPFFLLSRTASPFQFLHARCCTQIVDNECKWIPPKHEFASHGLMGRLMLSWKRLREEISAVIAAFCFVLPSHVPGGVTYVLPQKQHPTTRCVLLQNSSMCCPLWMHPSDVDLLLLLHPAQSESVQATTFPDSFWYLYQFTTLEYRAKYLPSLTSLFQSPVVGMVTRLVASCGKCDVHPVLCQEIRPCAILLYLVTSSALTASSSSSPSLIAPQLDLRSSKSCLSFSSVSRPVSFEAGTLP